MFQGRLQEPDQPLRLLCVVTGKGGNFGAGGFEVLRDAQDPFPIRRFQVGQLSKGVLIGARFRTEPGERIEVQHPLSERSNSLLCPLVFELLQGGNQMIEPFPSDFSDEPVAPEASLGQRFDRLAERLDAENCGQGVEQIRRAGGVDPAQLVVRQEGPVQVERLLPADAGEIGARLAAVLGGGNGIVEAVALGPGALYGGKARLALHLEPGRNPGGRSLVEVPPSFLPHLCLVRPAQGIAGEQHLERLGEAGLARSVAPGHHSQAGAGRYLQRHLGPNAPEPRDGDVLQVDGGRLPAAFAGTVRNRRARLDGFTFEHPLCRLLPGEGRQRQLDRPGVPTLILQLLLDLLVESHSRPPAPVPHKHTNRV